MICHQSRPRQPQGPGLLTAPRNRFSSLRPVFSPLAPPRLPQRTRSREIQYRMDRNGLLSRRVPDRPYEA